MALPSFFKRKDPKPARSKVADALADDAGPVQQARARARRRLIGAVVLLALGVIGFPMLFETQPRPLPQDIPIELPRREASAARPTAEPRSLPAQTGQSPPNASAAPAIPAPAGVAAVTETPATDAEPAPVPAVERGPVVSAEPKPAPSKAAAAPSRSEVDKPGTPKAADAARSDDARKAEAERARSLLEGRADGKAGPAAAAADGKAARYVVQVGAFTDPGALRDVRAKVEKLGLKTYTQSIETEAGKRTRVRVGPFASRHEAEAAGARLKDAGLPGNVLTL